ncbi:MAG TPA: 50S ribosomal protein L25/general stress protein Ctc [Terrimesophilobacter sp.]|nr:50S ribosomal protein L25/general stress protein Ctc [Terrimesophilobacter sp.]
MAEATHEKKIAKGADNGISAEVRDQFGKGAARKLRALGKIPAVLYGHGTDPQHVSLPGHETALIIRRANAIIDLDIAGKHQLALVKDVQKDPVRQIIEHLDLIIVKAGEKVQVDVAVHVVGEPAPGLEADQDAKALLIETLATSIPERLEANVEGLEAGAQILAKDIVLPAGCTLITEPDMLVVAISVPVEQDLGAEPEAAAEESAPAAEEAAE